MAQRNELALILSTPIEELAPKLISWNNTQLLAAVNESLESYRGKVYDEKSITEAKTDVAALRKFATALNSERIRIGKIYDAPLVKFKSEVDAVIQAINTVVSEGDKQIKAYETKRREEKCLELLKRDDLSDLLVLPTDIVYDEENNFIGYLMKYYDSLDMHEYIEKNKRNKEDIFDKYIACKENEWEEYSKIVSKWELDRYLNR